MAKFSLLALICLTFLCASCRREDPNPELLDPIYIDLVNELKSAEDAHAQSKASLEKAEKELSKSLPRTLDRKNAENDVARYKKATELTFQKTEYLKIRVERRKVEGRRAYSIAFRENRPWPDPKEYDHYKSGKRLSSSSKNWSDRVPKPEYHKSAAEKEAEKIEAAAKSSDGGD